MSLTELTTMLRSITGFSNKVAYRQFREGSAQNLPFIVYYVEGSDNFLADGKVYLPRQNVAIELYTQEKDVTTEALLEEKLNDNNIPWEKDEDYIDSEHMYMITYSITI